MIRRYIILILFFIIGACDDNIDPPELSGQTCPAPGKFQMNLSDDGIVQLSWEDLCMEESGYRVEKREGNGRFETLVDLPTNSQDYQDTIPATTAVYAYRVRALKDDLDNPSSYELSTQVPLSNQAASAYAYLTSRPQGYGSQPDSNFALMIFLHGAGERGNDLELVTVHGPPKLIRSGQQFSSIVVSPQCPPDQDWEVDRLVSTLDKIKRENRVDLDRVYLTGLSMGGAGTWNWAIESPETFAALVPICGIGNPAGAHQIKDIPTWVFHGALDAVIPASESEIMVAALKEAGGDPKFTLYPDLYHDSWTTTYNNPGLFDWMIQQKR